MVKSKRKRKQPLTAKQKKLVQQMPSVAAGKKSKKQAMIDAGYAETSANQQQAVLGALRNNEAMQAALRKVGVTEDTLAEVAKEGLGATRLISINFKTHEIPDHTARHSFFKTTAELMDAFPAKKLLDVTPPRTYSDLERKAKTVEEARRLAEEGGEEGS